VTTYPGPEQNWYPVSKLGWFTGHIREGITVTHRQLELLQPARSQPYLLGDATVAPIIGVHHDQAGDLDLFQDQADRWKASPDLTEAQRAGIAAYEALIAQLRQVNSEVLAAAAGLADGTIEAVLAKSGPDLLAALTPREREMLVLMAEARSDQGIADALVITLRAVERHVSAIFGKLGLPSTGTETRRVLAVLLYLGS